MKNLIDELHKLDEVEYKVSEDFSKRVMKNIKKAEKTNKFSNVISIASVGLVACLAVFAFHNSDIKTNIFNTQNSNNMEMAESKLDMAQYNNTDNMIIEEKEFMDKLEYSVEATNDAYNRAEATPESIQKGEVASDSAKLENFVEKAQSGDDYQSLEKALKSANIEYEVVENGIKINATQNEITGILNDFEYIDIDIDGEYIILKIKE